MGNPETKIKQKKKGTQRKLRCSQKQKTRILTVNLREIRTLGT